MVIGRDMRDTSEPLAAAFGRGVRERGVTVIDIGLASTDELYFAADRLDAHGAMFTASHNPAGYNGIKICGPGARPIALETGLGVVRDRVLEFTRDGIPQASGFAPSRTESMLPAYAARLHELVDLREVRPLKIVIDAGSGMAGHTVPGVLGDLAALDIVALNFELDGSFPIHDANPLDPANTHQLQQEVIRQGADLGLAFDGDADRCFVVDEKGERVSPSALAVLIGLREVERARDLGESDPVVLYNVITSKAVPELLAEAGVQTVRTRVGHSHIKAIMAERNAVFGAEHSGHFYFRDFSRADSGLLMAMHVIRALGSSKRTLSELIAPYDPYAASGEINTPTADVARTQDIVLADLADHWGRDALTVDRLDGLTVSHWDSAPRWWINLRPSNTEPLLRLNAESDDPAVLDQVLARVRHVIGQERN